MGSFLRFFSLSVLNQFCALLYQVVLLPLQLRIWGHEVAAHWFVFIAAANLTLVFDLGLRNAGHTQLLTSVRTGDPTAVREFRQTWALARLLMFGASAAFMVYELFMGMEPTLLTVTVIASYAMDTVIVVRGVWYDTLGYFTRVEVGFLAFTSVRLGLSIFALVVFHAPPETLGWIMFITAIGGLATQAYLFPQRILGLLAGGFFELRWQSLAVIRFVVADPMITWMRISLPVIVVGTIASAEVVATYVALRAVFGLSRQIISQLNRYGSVKYVHWIDSDRATADRIVARVILGCTVISVGVASAAIVDHGRILHIWLGLDTSHVFAIILAFSVGIIIFPYQVVSSVLMRSGDVAGVARRQYLLPVCWWHSRSDSLFLQYRFGGLSHFVDIAGSPHRRPVHWFTWSPYHVDVDRCIFDCDSRAWSGGRRGVFE